MVRLLLLACTLAIAPGPSRAQVDEDTFMQLLFEIAQIIGGVNADRAR